MATWPSSKASTTNLDSGTDSPAAARADIKTNVDNVNSIIDMFNIDTPADEQILQYNSANSRFELATPSTGGGGGISAVVDDLNPQLGGSLDVTGWAIYTTGGNIELEPEMNSYSSGVVKTSRTMEANILRSTKAEWDDGGKIELALNQDTSLSGSNVAIEVYQNKLRIYETGGSQRGAYIDLTTADASAGTNLLAGGISAVVDDTNPQLGNHLDINGYEIRNNSGDIHLQPLAPVGKVTTYGNIETTGDVKAKEIFSTNSSGDEGGQINLAKPETGSSISGTGVIVDVYQNKLRIFEEGGSARGAYIDLTAASSSVGSNLLGGPQYAIIKADAATTFDTHFNETTLTQNFVEVLDANNLVTVTTTSFTISNAGTYLIEYMGNKQLNIYTNNSAANLVLPELTIRLKNTTDSTTIYQDSFGGDRVYGTASGQAGQNNIGRIDFTAIVTITGSKTFGFTAALTSAGGYNTHSLTLSGTPKPHMIITKLA